MKMQYNKHEKYDEIIGTKTKQLVLDFFRQHKEGKFSTTDIHNKIDAPESSLNRALNDLERMRLLTSKKSGKFKFFRVNGSVWAMIDKTFSFLDQMKKYSLEQRKAARK